MPLLTERVIIEQNTAISDHETFIHAALFRCILGMYSFFLACEKIVQYFIILAARPSTVRID